MEYNRARQNYLLLSLWALWAMIYFFLIITQLKKPILGWGYYLWQVAQAIAQHGFSSVKFFVLPPLYTSLMAVSFKIFGLSELSARLPGVVCFLLMPPVIYFLIQEITYAKDRFLTVAVAAALFLSSPAAIQGSLVIEHSDTTLFMLLISLFYIFLFKAESRSLTYCVVFPGIMYGLCLWAKVTTALGVIVALPIAYFLSGEIKNGIKRFLVIPTTGIIFFVMSWGAFCYFVVGIKHFLDPIAYYTASAADTLLVFNATVFKKIALDIFRITLWFSPLLLLLGAVSIFDLCRKRSVNSYWKKDMQLIIFSGVVFFVYLYANATFSSFPKYIVPILPLLCCIIAKFAVSHLKEVLQNRRIWLILGLLFGAGVVYCRVLVGDQIRNIYLLRQAQLLGSVKNYFSVFFYHQMLYVFFPALIFLVSLCFISTSIARRLILAMLICLLAGNSALGLIQARAGYAVNFAYGAEGTEELRLFLRERPHLKVTTSDEGFMAGVGEVKFQRISGEKWDNPEEFLSLIQESPPECLIFGLACNGVLQLRETMENPDVKSYLDNHYQGISIGSYHVLLRKGREDIK